MYGTVCTVLRALAVPVWYYYYYERGKYVLLKYMYARLGLWGTLQTSCDLRSAAERVRLLSR